MNEDCEISGWIAEREAGARARQPPQQVPTMELMELIARAPWREAALVRGCGQAYALQTVEPVTFPMRYETGTVNLTSPGQNEAS